MRVHPQILPIKKFREDYPYALPDIDDSCEGKSCLLSLLINPSMSDELLDEAYEVLVNDIIKRIAVIDPEYLWKIEILKGETSSQLFRREYTKENKFRKVIGTSGNSVFVIEGVLVSRNNLTSCLIEMSDNVNVNVNVYLIMSNKSISEQTFNIHINSSESPNISTLIHNSFMDCVSIIKFSGWEGEGHITCIAAFSNHKTLELWKRK